MEDMLERRDLDKSQYTRVRKALIGFKSVTLFPYGSKGQSYILRGNQPVSLDNPDLVINQVNSRLIGYLGSNYVKFVPRFDSGVRDNLADVVDAALGTIPEQR